MSVGKIPGGGRPSAGVIYDGGNWQVGAGGTPLNGGYVGVGGAIQFRKKSLPVRKSKIPA